MATTAAIPTVAEFFRTAMPRPRRRRAAAQLDRVQATVDRGWVLERDLDDTENAALAGEELDADALEVYTQYCLLALRRPCFACRNWLAPEGAARVYVNYLRGPYHSLPPTGRRALLALTAAAASIRPQYGPDIDFRSVEGRHGDRRYGTIFLSVVVDAREAEHFITSVKDLIEEHVEQYDTLFGRREGGA